MPPVKSPIKLDDLSAEDRARLLAEAQTEARTEADEKAQEAAERIAALLRERDHLESCPVLDGEVVGNVEAYGVMSGKHVPRGSGLTPLSPVSIVRCIKCGGARTIDEPIEKLRERLAENGTASDEDPDDL